MVKVAVSGCVHGEIDKLYECLESTERYKGIKADILLCTGDFQAVRDGKDLKSLACPQKYRKMGDFHEYYSGIKQAKVLTVIVGGNHESSRYFHMAPNGGWIANNMYYLGRAGVVRCGSLRIAGVSGIYNYHQFDSPLPLTCRNDSESHSVFYTRRFDYQNLFQLSSPDIFMSHDWPQGVYHFGNTEDLLRKKPFLSESIRDNSLGSPFHTNLLRTIRP
jgi:lariat debranching enzyme